MLDLPIQTLQISGFMKQERQGIASSHLILDIYSDPDEKNLHITDILFQCWRIVFTD